MKYETIERIQRVTRRVIGLFCLFSLALVSGVVLVIAVTKLTLWLSQSVLHLGEYGMPIIWAFIGVLIASVVVALGEEK